MKDNGLDILVLGKGCDKYFELLKVVRNGLSKSKKMNRITEINNLDKIAQLGVRNLPALVINGKIVFQGINFKKEIVEQALGVK